MMYKSPGIPDIYISYQYKGKNDYNQTRTLEKSVCIEIETNPTPGSILKKTEQFTRPGVEEPIIIDMGEGYNKFRTEMVLQDEFTNDIDCIALYIDSRLVL